MAGSAHFTWERPWLYPLQRDAFFNGARYSVTEASTKAGKTLGCMVWLFEEALKCRRGEHVLWGAPWAKQAEIAYSRYTNYLDPKLFSGNEAKLRLKLEINGAYIDFRSLDNPDSVYGEDNHAAVMDEFTRTEEAALIAVRSTLTQTGGKLRLIGNVLNRGNWGYRFARMAEQKMRDGDPNYHYSKITAYDAAAAGIFPLSEIEDARSTMPENEFRALYLADPPDDGGNPFGLPAIVRNTMPEEWLGPGEPLCAGVDLGKSRDFSVVISLDREGNVVRFDRWQLDWKATINRIDGIVGYGDALVDSTGLGDPILTQLQNEADGRYEGYVFSMPSKQKLMEGLAVALQQDEIKFPDGPIRQELETFTYQFTKTGVRYEAAQGLHDDCVMALALAVFKWKELTRNDLPYAWLRNDPEWVKQFFPEEGS